MSPKSSPTRSTAAPTVESKAEPKPAAGSKPAAAVRSTASSTAARSTAGSKSAAKPASSSKSTAKRKPKPKKPSPEQVARRWATQLEKKRPGLVGFVLDRLADAHGRPAWQPRLDPISELILTILSANSADVNAEVAFAALRDRYPSAPRPDGAIDDPMDMPGWGGRGLPDLPPPDWAAVEAAPIEELTDVIRPGGLANQKAPRIPAALGALRENAGSYSLEFLRDLPALEARDWLAAIPGIGKKTASVVLLFSYGVPLMPVDRHVFRVSQRIGLIPPTSDPDKAHDYYLAMLEPEQMYEAHVSLIMHGRRTCHAQRPDCEHCPVAPRCRYFDPKAE
jgi:endonuclease-3